MRLSNFEILFLKSCWNHILNILQFLIIILVNHILGQAGGFNLIWNNELDPSQLLGDHLGQILVLTYSLLKSAEPWEDWGLVEDAAFESHLADHDWFQGGNVGFEKRNVLG